MKKHKRFFSLLISFVMAVSMLSIIPVMTATAETYGDYEGLAIPWWNDGEFYISGYNGSETDLSIPAEINGMTVCGIDEQAFYDNDNLISVTIPDSVTYIGHEAFADCDYLKSVVIGNGVSDIGGQAFSECRSLETITFGNSVSNISYDAFYNTLWLKNMRKENPLVIVNGLLIDGQTCSGDVTIPDGVTKICDEAFCGCWGLTSVTIPNSVTSIGYGAFLDCTNLTDVTLPSDITDIGGEAFEYTPWWEQKKQDNPLIIINGLLIDGTACTGDVIIPEGVTTIASNAFAYCDNITSVTISNDVEKIGQLAFESCKNLKEVTIGSNLQSIGYGAFRDCKNLTDLTISDGLTEIEGEAFHGCTNLMCATIPKSVESIGYHAFGYGIYDENEDIYYEDEQIEGFKIKGYLGTAAEDYAQQWDVDFEALDDLLNNAEIKYQLRGNEEEPEYADIRFILIVDEEDVLNADSASFYAKDCWGGTTDTININRAYRSIIAGGKKITADEGKVFIIAKMEFIPYDMLYDGITAYFTLDGKTCYRTIT